VRHPENKGRYRQSLLPHETVMSIKNHSNIMGAQWQNISMESSLIARPPINNNNTYSRARYDVTAMLLILSLVLALGVASIIINP
jgi:hypothetical protein